MAFTSNDLTALEKAIAQGVTDVQYADRKVTYRSLKEMLQLREIMRAELGVTEPVMQRVKMETSKGL